MKKIATALLLSTVVAAPAFAADEGFYAGVTLGSARVGVPAAFGGATKNSDTVYGILGGYQFNKNWAAELEYTGAGKFTTATSTGKADAFGVTAVGTLPMSDTFSLYGKLGFAQVTGKANGAAANANRTSATYGLGLQYNVTPAVGIRAGWDRFGAAAKTAAGATQNYNSNVYSVGAVFKF